MGWVRLSIKDGKMIGEVNLLTDDCILFMKVFEVLQWGRILKISLQVTYTILGKAG